MIQKFQTISLRRKIVSLAMAAMVAVGGIASWAAVTDTFTQTNNFRTASINLTGNDMESLSIDWAPAISGQPYLKTFTVNLKNTGTAELRYAIVPSVTYTPTTPNGWTAARWAAFAATTCTSLGEATSLQGVGSALGGGAVGSPTAGQNAGDRTLAAGASEDICLKVYGANGTALTLADVDSAVQTLNFVAEATGL